MSNPGSKALAETEAILSRFIDAPIKIERRAQSLVVVPTENDTFPVTIYDEGDSAMVAAERWHCHYEDPKQAAFCVMWLLTPFYRIVHEFKGVLIAAAWLERYEAEGWAPFEPAYFLNPDVESEWQHDGDWIRVIRTQFVLPSPWPYEEVSPGALLDGDGLPVNFKIGIVTETGREPVGLVLK